MGVLKSYFQKPILIILFLGFASGVPLALLLTTVKAYLVDKSVDLASIGFFSLVLLPYSIKFFWAPLLDSVKIPVLTRKLGKRRSWIISMQILMIILIAFLGIFSNSDNLSDIIILSVLIAITSASHDIVVDAYRVESVEVENQAIAASMYIYGYRIGMLVAGALALILADQFSWNLVYYFVAAVMGIGVLTTLLAKEKGLAPSKKDFHFPTWFKTAVIDPFVDFTNHPRWYIILIFVVCFKLTDAFAGNLSLPFLLDIGFTKTEIATIVKTFGLFATLLGAFLGGFIVKKIGLMKSLYLAAIIQMVSNFGYYYLTLTGNDAHTLYTVIFLENLSGGIGDVVFVAYLSSLCNFKFTATQYSLLASLASVARSFIASPAGIVAEKYGWGDFFLLSIILGLPSLILLYIINSKKSLKDNKKLAS